MGEAAAIFAAFKWFASSPFLIDLLKKGYSYLGMDVDKKLRKLQNIIIPRMEILIGAAENSPHKDRLHGWLKSLEDAVYEAEDALDLHDYYLLKQKVRRRAGGITVRLESLPLIKYLIKNCSIVPQNIKLKKSLMKLEKTAGEANEILPLLGLSNVTESQTTQKSGRMVTTSRLTHKVFGRDKQRDDIVDLLHETAELEPESSSIEKYSVIAIVGLGGAGKTTLAQYVCDYEKNAQEKHFDVVMWVHVSQILDVDKLTRKMVESASGGACPDYTNLDALQKKLEDSLRSKKFLLVLDDVWSKKEVAEVKQLLAPLSVGEKGSKILITTREKEVADSLGTQKILPLEELEKNDFLSLFMYYAFGDDKIDDAKIADNSLYEELKEIVRENAPQLHGSPLAARMVGSQLRKRPNVDFWKRILGGDLLKDIRKSLMWSYQSLDIPLQRCFSYCSLFLKGQEIWRDKLIHLWIAEGFIKPTDESKTIQDIGREYFDDLLASSFFQPTKDDRFYTIHDLLHDLAEMVSKGRCLRVEGNLTEAVVPRVEGNLTEAVVRQDIRHLSIPIDTLTSDLVEKICNFKNLRTLFIVLTRTHKVYWNDEQAYCNDELLDNIFVKLEKLRVVDLSKCSCKKLPESIGGLKHLRYLHLPRLLNENLPESIYTLYHLEFLHIDNYTLLADRLANWINMQHLYFNSMFLNGAELGCLKQLGNLRNYWGLSLHINGLENFKEKGEAPVDIKGFKNVRLEWSTADNNGRSSYMDAQVLEGLHPSRNLRHLEITGYQGCLLPSWMVGDRHLLHNLTSLKLIKCRQLKLLPIISPTLRELELYGCSSLPTVSKEDLAIIRSTQDTRISQVVTFMECLVATYGYRTVSEIEWDLCGGYDSRELRNRLEKAMEEEEEEAQLVLPPSLESLDINSCRLTNSSLREGLQGLTSLKSLNLVNIVSLTSLPSADVLGRLKMLERLHIRQCWFLTSLGGLQALVSLEVLDISFCPSLCAEGDGTSVLLPSSLKWLEIEACRWKHRDDSRHDPTCAVDAAEASEDIPFAASLQLGHMKSLRSLSITRCPNIGSLLGLRELNNLEYLTLMGCPKLAHAETKLGRLRETFETDAPSLLPMLLAEEALASLSDLHIAMFEKESFSSEEEQVFQHLNSLTSLYFWNCSIKSLPTNLESLSSLEEMLIVHCPNIMSLPDLPRSLSKLELSAASNPVLERRYRELVESLAQNRRRARSLGPLAA